MVLKELDKTEDVPTPPVRNSSDKQADKKRELALHTLSALAELGFARVNLREVAARSGTSLGSIHYYFEDKTELLIYCIRLYKDGFIRHLEALIDSADDLADLVNRLPEALARAVEEDGHTHRLWYDVRAQALFDPAFQPVVDEIERRLLGVVEQFLAKARALGLEQAPSDALGMYLNLDGMFRYFLQQRLAGNGEASTTLRRRLEEMFPGR